MVSKRTHILKRHVIDTSNNSIYTAQRFANGTVTTMTDARLRHLVAWKIGQNRNLSQLALKRDKNSPNIKKYLEKISKGKIQDQEIELSALALLCRLLIYVVVVDQSLNGMNYINVLNSGELPVPFDECICLLYDKKKNHYDVLCAINRRNPAEIIKVMNSNVKDITKLLEVFIREELHYDGHIQFDCDYYGTVNEPTMQSEMSNDNDFIFEMITPSAGKNSTISNYERIKFSQTKRTLMSSSDEAHDSSESSSTMPKKRRKISTSDIPVKESVAFTEDSQTRNPTVASNSPIGSEPLDNVPVTSNTEENMRFKHEPCLTYRFRLKSEFEPKKATKRNGEPSEPGAPRYFVDENNNNYFSLLIPVSFIPGGDISRYRLEICIATRDIDNYRYIHPYFKFRVKSKNGSYQLFNRMYIYLNDDLALGEESETLRKLDLQFAVVMHTNKELMQSQQPLRILSSPNNTNDEQPIKTIFDNHEAFKGAYHLDELCFVVTLWSKAPGENNFHRHEDKQYISRISTQDKEAKVPKNDAKSKLLIYENLCNFIFEHIESE